MDGQKNVNKRNTTFLKFEMTSHFSNFIDVSQLNNLPNSFNSENNTKPRGEQKDALEGAGEDCEPIECIYKRLNETVFAESLRSNADEDEDNILETNKGLNEQITFIEDVTVQRRIGKRSKYIFECDSDNPVCPQKTCKRTFKNTKQLRAHIRNVHCSDRNKYQCEVCSSSFPAKYLLTRHMAIHEERKIECPVCQKLLSTRTNLQVHIRSHADIRPHSCRVCQKAFARASILRRHMILHRNGDYECNKCLETFKRRRDYEMHMKLHSLPVIKEQ